MQYFILISVKYSIESVGNEGRECDMYFIPSSSLINHGQKIFPLDENECNFG